RGFAVSKRINIEANPRRNILPAVGNHGTRAPWISLSERSTSFWRSRKQNSRRRGRVVCGFLCEGGIVANLIIQIVDRREERFPADTGIDCYPARDLIVVLSIGVECIMAE